MLPGHGIDVKRPYPLSPFMWCYTKGAFVGGHADRFPEESVRVTIPASVLDPSSTDPFAKTEYQLRDPAGKPVGVVHSYEEKEGWCLLHDIVTGGVIPTGKDPTTGVHLSMWHKTTPAPGSTWGQILFSHTC